MLRRKRVYARLRRAMAPPLRGVVRCWSGVPVAVTFETGDPALRSGMKNAAPRRGHGPGVNEFRRINPARAVNELN